MRERERNRREEGKEGKATLDLSSLCVLKEKQTRHVPFGNLIPLIISHTWPGRAYLLTDVAVSLSLLWLYVVLVTSVAAYSLVCTPVAKDATLIREPSDPIDNSFA